MAEQHLAFHAAAEIFPLMDDRALRNLAADIEEHGLKEPIVLHPDGSILDGRNRYLACQRADVTPRFRTWDGIGSALDYVISLNLQRRHLTPGQLGLLALKVKPLLEAEARERQLSGLRKGSKSPLPTSVGNGGKSRATTVARASAGEANELAGATVGVSGKAVERAARVVRDGVPALVDAVQSGDLSLNAAAQIATRPKDEQVEIVGSGTKEAAHAAWTIDQGRRAISRVEAGESQPVEKKQALPGLKRLPRQSGAAIFRRTVQALQGICVGLANCNTAEVLKASDAVLLRDSLREAIKELRHVYVALGGKHDPS